MNLYVCFLASIWYYLIRSVKEIAKQETNDILE